MKKTRETWATRFGFIMATAGFAIGLGNIWRFPYMVGSNGGGAFLLVYLVFAFLIGIPLLTAEIGLGRRAGLTPLAGMARLTGSRKHPWNALAWLSVGAAVLIQSYYVMLIGWLVGYFVRIVNGDLRNVGEAELESLFASFTASPGPVFFYTSLVVLCLALTVTRGLRGGLERVATLAMPLLLVLLLILTFRSLSFEGSMAGLRWYLTPDFSALDGKACLAALGQAFYSIGLGMAASFSFGSYLNRERSDVPGNAAIVVLCDTGIAVLAGLMIFPALFAFGFEPDAGPGLLFVTMTSLFAKIPAGSLFGALFFFLLILAAITSAASIHEALTMTWVDSTGISRTRATWLMAAIFMTLATPIILSQGPWRGDLLFGMDLFVLVDTLSGNILLPGGALVLTFYVVRGWGFEAFQREVNRGAGSFRITKAWRPIVVFLIPLAVIIISVSGLL